MTDIRARIWATLKEDILDDIEYAAQRAAEQKFDQILEDLDYATQEYIIIRAVYDYLQRAMGA